MDHYYALQKPLPDDFSYLCRVARCHSRHEKSCLRTVLATYFEIINHQVTHSRIEEEIVKYQQSSDAARNAAAKRWHSEPICYSEARSQNTEESTSYAAQQAAPPKINGVHKDESQLLTKLPLRGGGEFEIRQSLVEEFTPIYPGVDVSRTILEMRGWCLGNAERLKTRRGIKRFINAWLKNEQEKYDNS